MNVSRIMIASMLLGFSAFSAAYSCKAQDTTNPNSLKPTGGIHQGKCMTSPTTSGGSITFSTCSLSEKRQGWFYLVRDGHIRLRNASTGLCMQLGTSSLTAATCLAGRESQNFIPTDDLNPGLAGYQVVLCDIYLTRCWNNNTNTVGSYEDLYKVNINTQMTSVISRGSGG